MPPYLEEWRKHRTFAPCYMQKNMTQTIELQKTIENNREKLFT